MTKITTLFAAGVVAVTALAPWYAGVTQANESGVLEFSAAEINRILSHGPWPMQWMPDATNRVSGNRHAIDLGERLFFDEKLSVTGNV